MQNIFEKLGVIMKMLVPGPFNVYHKVKHNSAIICQNLLEFWNQKANRVSHSNLKIMAFTLIFSVPDPLL